jgi:Protein of unknown function (DUF983)
MLGMRCPRCRRGDMFKNRNPWKLKQVLHMHEHCPVCDQKFEMEPGFWYGTGYVSYALALAVCAISFVIWFFTIGMSLKDNRFFTWMVCNAVLLVVLQPWLMRFSRSMYIYFFVKYDPDYEEKPVQKFDY